MYRSQTWPRQYIRFWGHPSSYNIVPGSYFWICPPSDSWHHCGWCIRQWRNSGSRRRWAFPCCEWAWLERFPSFLRWEWRELRSRKCRSMGAWTSLFDSVCRWRSSPEGKVSRIALWRLWCAMTPDRALVPFWWFCSRWRLFFGRDCTCTLHYWADARSY